MRLSTAPLCLAVSLFMPAGLFAKTDYASLLPASTDLYLEISSLSKLESLDTLPIFKPFQAPELKKFFAPLLKKMEDESSEASKRILKEETGLTEQELDAKFPQGFSFSIYDYKINPKEDVSWSLEGALMAEFSGDEALAEKILTAIGKTAQQERADAKTKKSKDSPPAENEDFPSARFPEDYVETKADYKGVSLHLWKLKPEAHDVLDQFAWAVNDGVLIYSSAESEIKTLLDRQKSGSTKDTLAGSATHRGVLDRAGPSDILVSADLTGIIAQGIKSLAEAGAKSRKPTDFNPSKLVDALGASDFRNIFLSMNFSADQADLSYGVTYARKPGLFSIFAFGPDSGTAPGFLPPEVKSASYGRFDQAATVSNIEKLVADIYPPAGILLTGQLAQLKAATGVDLKADLLANLDKDVFSVAEPRPPKANADEADADEDNPLQSLASQNQVIGFKLKDRAAFELALKSLINGLAPDKALFETREYMGFKIQAVKGAEESPMPVAYVLTDDYLLFSIGQSSLLEKVLGRISKKSADGVFSNPVIAGALDKLPGSAFSVGYQDMDSLVQMLIQALAKIAEKSAQNDGPEIVDPKSIPKNLHFPHYVVSKSTMDDNAMVVKARLLARPEGK